MRRLSVGISAVQRRRCLISASKWHPCNCCCCLQAHQNMLQIACFSVASSDQSTKITNWLIMGTMGVVITASAYLCDGKWVLASHLDWSARGTLCILLSMSMELAAYCIWWEWDGKKFGVFSTTVFLTRWNTFLLNLKLISCGLPPSSSLYSYVNTSCWAR